MIFTTLSNEKYMLQGVALAHSLKAVIPSDVAYKIYYLCLDQYTYDMLHRLGMQVDLNIIPILYTELETKYPQIITLKMNNYSEYCFSFSALLPKYIFDVYNESSVLYIDSDVLFYHTPQLIYDEIGDSDIGIVRHRFNDRTHGAGEYNANMIYFKNNENGNKVLDWWHISYMTKTPAHLSSCGDQKFLEGFEDVIGKERVCVVDDIVGHGAPWNYSLYGYYNFTENPKKIDWDGKEQIFVFNHFSQFEYDFDMNWFSYSGRSHMEYTFGNKLFEYEPKLHSMYAEYYDMLNKLNNEFNLNVRKKK